MGYPTGNLAHKHSSITSHMDRIEPNSNPSPVHRNSLQQGRDAKRAEPHTPPKEQTPKTSAYSEIFDDRELERLQNNLQSVSDLASKALERLKK